MNKYEYKRGTNPNMCTTFWYARVHTLFEIQYSLISDEMHKSYLE